MVHSFDLDRHRALTAEGVRLRSEIRKIALEYGIDWDEDIKNCGEEVRKNIELERRSNREGRTEEDEPGKEKDIEEDKEGK